MKKITLLILAVALSLTTFSQSFYSYRVDEVFKGKRPKIVLGKYSNDEVIKASAKSRLKTGEIDFAGYFTIFSVWCGGGCYVDYMIDLRTGIIYKLPVSKNRDESLGPIEYEYQSNSNLLILNYAISYSEAKEDYIYGKEYYIWDD